MEEQRDMTPEEIMEIISKEVTNEFETEKTNDIIAYKLELLDYRYNVVILKIEFLETKLRETLTLLQKRRF